MFLLTGHEIAGWRRALRRLSARCGGDPSGLFGDLVGSHGADDGLDRVGRVRIDVKR